MNTETQIKLSLVILIIAAAAILFYFYFKVHHLEELLTACNMTEICGSLYCRTGVMI